MTPTLSAQQLAFFTKSGFLELEGLLTIEECREFLALMKPKRDLWRHQDALQRLVLSKKLTSLVLQSTDERVLRLGFDQWMPPEFHLEKPAKLSELFCLQGLECIVALRFGDGELPPTKASLGLAPFPQAPGNALLIRPNLLLQWPTTPFGLYLVGYTLPNAVYVQNSRDPAGGELRKFGYAYGDILRNDTHPLVQRR